MGHAEEDFEAFLAEEERIAEADFPVLCLEILLNPHATYPWPPNLIGVYDTVYKWDAQTEQFTVAYEGSSPSLGGWQCSCWQAAFRFLGRKQ
ncbi:MAG: hypothetical protein N2554_00435 [Fimbriimonadales bacterium]|nr:hypothetical protein [Fimbriimonadales bacterium]